MRKGRKGRQTGGRRHTIHWGRFLLFLILLVSVAALVALMIFLLSGGGPARQAPPTPTPIAPLALPSASTPSPTPRGTLPPDLTLAPIEGARPEEYGFITQLQINREDAGSFQRQPPIRFGDEFSYTSLPGVLTFGGSHYRETFAYGTASLPERTLTRIWEVPLGRKSAEDREKLGSFSGTGWTGMPILVQWPAETRALLGIKEAFREQDDLVEVIYPAQDGNIYFMELETGQYTREPLQTGVITRGTAALDPRGYPLLYTGQSIPATAEGVYGSWFRIIDLIQNKEVWSFGGKDPFSHREWQAFTGSALVHAASDTLIVPGENGVLYTVKLNSSFDAAAGTVSVAPDGLEKYRYTAAGYSQSDAPGSRWMGMETSVSVFRNHAFFADNGGMLQCVNLNTLELEYAVDLGDDCDTTILIEEDASAGTFYLYAATQAARQESSEGQGTSKHIKLDGRTGMILWQKEYEAAFSDTASYPGTISTPHAGRGNLSDMVFYNTTLMPVTYEENGEQKNGRGGWLIAYEKSTGRELWRQEQKDNYWASPVVVYDESGTGYLIQADRNGMLRVWEPRTGQMLFELDMGSAIVSTPAVFGNTLVVGTIGRYGNGESQKIIGVRIG